MSVTSRDAVIATDEMGPPVAGSVIAPETNRRLVTTTFTVRFRDLRTDQIHENSETITGTLTKIGNRLIAAGDIDPSRT
jgi:hypothetical protein